MLDSVCAGIGAITNGIQTAADAGKWIFNLNYCLVTTVGHYAWKCLAVTIHYAGLAKLALAIVWGHVSYFTLEVYEFLGSVCFLMLKLASHIYKLGNMAYLNSCSAFETFSEFVGNGSTWVKCTVIDMYNLFAAAASHSASFIVGSVSTILFIVASLVAACVNFINATWNGLGFALSSVAGFPSFLSQSANNVWKRLVESAGGLLMATTKETYLAVVMLCIVYLILSNILRFFSCQSLPLFSRRLTRRRHRAPPRGNPLGFDRGFESDFEEDVFDLDPEGGRDRNQPPWLNDLDSGDSSQADNNSSLDSSDGDVSDNDDIADEANDSDEIREESDNDEEDDDNNDSSDDADSLLSHNSLTYSTASSENDIEVQLPPLDQHYGLRSRSSTPARPAGDSISLNSREDFSWEMERERDKRKCVVCQDEIKCVLVLPCRHLCMCVRCADQFVKSTSRTPARRICPLCRTKISKVMNIYV